MSNLEYNYVFKILISYIENSNMRKTYVSVNVCIKDKFKNYDRYRTHNYVVYISNNRSFAIIAIQAL